MSDLDYPDPNGAGSPAPPQDGDLAGLSPLPPINLANLENDYEENWAPEDYELETLDIILMSLRCAITLICAVLIVLIFVSVARGLRVKSWRLYLLTGMTLFAWLGMSLYQDHIDTYYTHFVYREAQTESIYRCVRNLVHGLTLYLIVLLLSHMSDFQHHGSWLGLVFSVILVPLVYSVALLIVDLRLDNQIRRDWRTEVGISSVRVAFFNVATTVLVFVLTRRICTRTLYGTYEDERRPLVVLMARWTYVFLVLHNLTEMASFASGVVARLPTTEDYETVSLVHRCLDEAKYFVIVLAVPFSYVIAGLANCCCGVDDQSDSHVEMDGMDKIYQEVWTPGAGSRTTQIQNKPLPVPEQPAVRHNPSTNPNGVTSTPTKSNGTNSSFQGSNSTLTSIGEDSIGQLPNLNSSSASRRPLGGGGGPMSAQNGRMKKNRESYLEAVSMGSLDGNNSFAISPSGPPAPSTSNKGVSRSHNSNLDKHSISSEPIDL